MKCCVGSDPASGGSLTVFTLVGAEGIFDSFVLPVEFDLGDVLILKGGEDDRADESTPTGGES